MGVLRSLLTAPVAGPPKGLWWLLQQVVGVAEAELYDEGRIIAQLRQLNVQVDAGEISEDEHAEAEAVLLDRLAEARRRNTVEEAR